MIKKMALTSLFLLVSLMFLGQPVGRQIEVKPTGVYAQIDMKEANKMTEVLVKDGSRKKKDRIIQEILANPNKYIPPVLCAMSYDMMKQGKKDEGAYWFLVGLLRTVYDVKRCTDNSVGDTVTIVNINFGTSVYKYILPTPAKFTELVDKAMDFVKKNNEEYDQRWINLRGLDAFIEEKNGNSKELSKPKEEWPKIKDQALIEFQEGFLKELQKMYSNNPGMFGKTD